MQRPPRSSRSEAEPSNRRGSPEAIAKRRAARAFNDLLDPSGSRLDGRTEQRRRRLLVELESGKHRGSGVDLKPVDILTRVDELLGLGETLVSLRKHCPPPPLQSPTERLVELVAALHRAYGFRPEAYRFVGVPPEILRRAGVATARPAESRSSRRTAKRVGPRGE